MLADHLYSRVKSRHLIIPKIESKPNKPIAKLKMTWAKSGSNPALSEEAVSTYGELMSTTNIASKAMYAAS